MSPSRSRPTTKRKLDGAQPLLGLPGVGATTASRLAAAGLHRVEQLATFAPRRYDDAGELRPIAELTAGERVFIEGEVKRASIRRFFRRATLEVTIADETGAVLLRWFRFRGQVPERFTVGRRVRAAGLVRAGKRGIELAQPIAEAVDSSDRLAHDAVLRPRYAPVRGMAPSRIEKLCALAAEATLADPDGVPSSLPSLVEAVRAVHLRAASTAEERAALVAGRAPAQKRLAFEELLLLRLRARADDGERATPIRGDLQPFLGALPYAPTSAQRREIDAVTTALAGDRPMRRLLTGDVGSGKTLVAAAAIALAVGAGRRAAMLLPTMLLAEQQAASLSSLLPAARIALLHGGTRVAERRAINAQLADPASGLDVIVGTHALLEEALPIAGLGLVVIDEQQRFGVAARAALVDKSRKNNVVPHQLALSATPIPRTLALALRGALSVGRLDEAPPGRGPIATTRFCERNALDRALDEVKRALDEGGQIYWVCPQIEAGQGRGAIEAAEWLAEHLGLHVALCHGKQRPDERREALAEFRQGRASVLCATTVVEVGLDVPGATLMVIEEPERLGLSALHQLRGRVGRGEKPGRCILCAPGASSVERDRLDALTMLEDGLAIAELDLQRRGMGELGGVQQSGMPALPPLPSDDLVSLIEEAERAAVQILARDPALSEIGHARLRRALADRRRWDAADGS